MEKTFLYLFWIAMLCCASLMISIIWFEEVAPERVFKLAGSLFVFGLANFLLWAPVVTYRFLKKR